MSIKKSLLALVMAAMAVMAFASPALAAHGKFRDVIGTAEMGANRELHAVGWAKFATGAGSYSCHVTSIVKSTTASTGTLTTFTVPDTTKCTGTGLLNGCTLKAHEPTNLPWDVTVTDNGRIDITDAAGITLHIKYGNCAAPEVTLTYHEIQLTILGTGERVVTGTSNKLGGTAALNEPIAGFEIDGATGPGGGVPIAHVKNIFGGETTENITSTTGESELTEADRCTWEISAT